MKKRSREKPAIQLGQMLLLQEKMQINMNRYTNADVDHWLLKALETGHTYFHFCFPVCKNKVTRERMVCKQHCAPEVQRVCHWHQKMWLQGGSLSLHDPCGRAIPKNWPWQILFLHMHTLYTSIVVLLCVTLKCAYSKYSHSMNKELQSGEKWKGCEMVESWQWVRCLFPVGIFTNLRSFAALNMCQQHWIS